MRSDVAPLQSKDVVRTVKVLLFTPPATFRSALSAGINGGQDLSRFVSDVSTSHNNASVTLVDLNSDVCEQQPRPGNLVAIYAQEVLYFLGIIDSISNYTQSRGVSRLTLTIRSRDGFGAWRDNHFVTRIFPEGTELTRIAVSIAHAMGLSNDEILLTDTGYVTPHPNSQMADMSPWEMLRTIFQAASSEPMIDMVGRLKMASRDTTRPADIVLDPDRVIEIRGGAAKSAITNVKLRWLDKELSKVSQQDQVLARESITAGFFQHRYERDEWFSEDHTQRVEGSYFVVKQSANSGVRLGLCHENYYPIDIYHGQIVVEVEWFVETLIFGLIALKVFIAATPDSGGLPCYPIGRFITAVIDMIIMGIISSIGTGHYEVWGQPYDYVHGRNTTEAFDINAPDWMDNEMVIDNDFISNEAHASKVSREELIYQANSATSWGVTIVDDPRVEVGDIIQIDNNTRIYVQSFERNLTRGTSATLSIRGFRV